MSHEFSKIHRPRKIEDVVGQAAAVKTLRGFKKLPHVILFAGPSGTGKTTMARALARELGCPEETRWDYSEVNCATVEPLDTVREIKSAVEIRPLATPVRVWVLDEVQSLSRARFAQEGLLKILEDVPAYVYFFLCTTDPKKILPAVRNRCTDITLKAVAAGDVTKLLRKVAAAERLSVADEVLEKITDAAEGSPRRALVMLEKVAGVSGTDAQLETVGRAGAEKGAFDLARVLLYAGRPVWKDVANVLKALEEEEPEGLRQMLLACARKQLLDKGDPKAFVVIDALDKPFYDGNKAGHAVLAARCWDICDLLNSKK